MWMIWGVDMAVVEGGTTGLWEVCGDLKKRSLKKRRDNVLRSGL
jgi:hypothetical protein